MKKKRLEPLLTVSTDRPWTPDKDYESTALPEIEVAFDDEFAPSSAKFGTSDPAIGSDPVRRLLFYNEQTHVTFLDAVSRAVQLGCPSIVNGFPLTFTRVDEAFRQELAAALHRIVPALKEGSLDWLYVQCYVRWVVACIQATLGAPRLVIAETMFFAGAAAREIELTVRNKKDALRGKGTLRATSEGGTQKAKNFAPARNKVLFEMQRRVKAGQPVKEAASIVARRGYGKSAEANRALWYRHQLKKL